MRRLILMAAFLLSVGLASGCTYTTATYERDGVAVQYGHGSMFNDRKLADVEAGVDEDGIPNVKIGEADNTARVDAVTKLLETAR